MYQGVFVKQESHQLHLTVVGEELDFPNPPAGILGVIVTPLLSKWLPANGHSKLR